MHNLLTCKKITILGGGTAGGFAALEMRRLFGASVEVTVIESSQIGIIGAGKGSMPNMLTALHRYGINVAEFMRETQATYKLGVSFECWRHPNTRPDARDSFYHLFSTTRDTLNLREWNTNGTYPLAASLIHQNIAFDAYPNACRWIEDCATQEQTAQHLGDSTEFAYHFDARKLADYLRRVAKSRGVKVLDAVVQEVQLGAQGEVAGLRTATHGVIDGDFFIDASGLRQLIIGKTLGARWRSFKLYLTLDRALPFFMPLPEGASIPLVTRAVALKSGWMWVIPTQVRLGCGYVYSSAHIDEAQAVAELSAEWGAPIEPVNRLQFEAGQFEKVWIGNAMAVGLSSGFVEPLEATSIGQTLSQLAYFGDLMLECQGVVTSHLIERFNTQTAAYWDGLLDFLLLHYESPRRGSPYWCDVAALERPLRYQELLQAFKLRTPRDIDFLGHAAGSGIMFGAMSWMLVAAPLGVVSAAACVQELARLSTDDQRKLLAFIKALQPPVHYPKFGLLPPQVSSSSSSGSVLLFGAGYELIPHNDPTLIPHI
jgi:tryptophan 7-halogenase